MPEILIFERSRPGRCAATLPRPDVPLADLPEGLVRDDLPLPEVSEVDLVSIEDNVLRVRRLDAINGTPILDLKSAQ